LAGRKTTPVHDSYEGADGLIIVVTYGVLLSFLALMLLIALIRKPFEIILACSSFNTVFLFAVLRPGGISFPH
jgi:hypothetical protein